MTLIALSSATCCSSCKNICSEILQKKVYLSFCYSEHLWRELLCILRGKHVQTRVFLGVFLESDLFHQVLEFAFMVLDGKPFHSIGISWTSLKTGRLEIKVPERVDRIFAAAESRAERGDHASLAVFADEAVPQDLEDFSQTYASRKLKGTFVKVEPLKGTWVASLPIARMHSLRARSDLLMSAPSWRVMRSELIVSAPRSFPARSMRENMPCVRSSWVFLPGATSESWKTAWLLEEFEFADVWPEVRQREPSRRTLMTSSTVWTTWSTSPTVLE